MWLRLVPVLGLALYLIRFPLEDSETETIRFDNEERICSLGVDASSPISFTGC